jgi:hypothetical protein
MFVNPKSLYFHCWSVEHSRQEPTNDIYLKDNLAFTDSKKIRTTFWIIFIFRNHDTSFQIRWEAMWTKSCKGKCCYCFQTLSLIWCHFTCINVLVFPNNEIAVILLCSDNDFERHIGKYLLHKWCQMLHLEMPVKFFLYKRLGVGAYL